jgi:hypothetical protein
MLNLFVFDGFEDSTSAFAFAKKVGGTAYLPEMDGGDYPRQLTPPVVYIEVEADSALDQHWSTDIVEEYSGRFAFIMHQRPDDPKTQSRL